MAVVTLASSLQSSLLPNHRSSHVYSHSCTNFGPVGASSSSSARRFAIVGILLHHISLHKGNGRDCNLRFRFRRVPRITPFVSQSDDLKYPKFEADEWENARRLEEADKTWNKILESFKQRSLMLRSQSREAYEVYLTKAMKALKETSKDIKIQADKASHDIAAIAKEIGEEGLEYLAYADENSPESVKNVVEVFSAPPEFNDVSKFHDFHHGIPYGALLALGGFVSFMFTGSTSAIRFGVIVGSALLYLSVLSLGEWKRGKSTFLLPNNQAAVATIATMIFLRECLLLLQRPSMTLSLKSIVSGAVLVFYVCRIIILRRRQNLDQGSEN